MSRRRVEFVLTMPGVGSWNGQWSGAGKHYAIVKPVMPETLNLLGIGEGKRGWSYCWDDGWSAYITARVLAKGERVARSAGFCGYEWMVTSILRCGRIETGSEATP